MATQKQVEWAVKIRAAAHAEMRELSAALDAAGRHDEAAAAQSVAEKTLGVKDAEWLIANRDDFAIAASHPAQLANGMGWGKFRTNRILQHPACRKPIMGGMGMVDEGRTIHTALRELAEQQ